MSSFFYSLFFHILLQFFSSLLCLPNPLFLALRLSLSFFFMSSFRILFLLPFSHFFSFILHNPFLFFSLSLSFIIFLHLLHPLISIYISFFCELLLPLFFLFFSNFPSFSFTSLSSKLVMSYAFSLSLSFSYHIFSLSLSLLTSFFLMLLLLLHSLLFLQVSFLFILRLSSLISNIKPPTISSTFGLNG